MDHGQDPSLSHGLKYGWSCFALEKKNPNQKTSVSRITDILCMHLSFFQCNFQAAIPHLCLQLTVTLSLFQLYCVNLADVASLLFGNCTGAGSKGWPGHLASWTIVSLWITAINISLDKCLGIEGEGTGELSSFRISSEDNLGCTVVYHQGSWLYSSSVSCLHYWTKWWFCSKCYLFGFVFR